MADEYAFFVEGLTKLADFENLSSVITANGAMSINDTLSFARTEGARIMMTEVSFPEDYLAPAGGRFSVTRRASAGDLSGMIVARQRPTSLARFSASGNAGDHPMVGVRRGKGLVVQKRAFLIKLRSGNTYTRNNLGLAIRMKKGETLTKSRQGAVELEKGLYLLYGPSVDQVFRTLISGETDYIRRVGDRLESEFNRLLGVFQ